MTDTDTCAVTPITCVAQLKDDLAAACFVEMSTIPLYLYAMYSVKSQIQGNPMGYVGGVNLSSSASAVTSMSAYRTIRGVVLEEMLHLTLARNVLYSIGGTIKYYDPDFVPKYGVVDGKQQYMLNRWPLLAFNLEACTKDQVENTFIPLESRTPQPPPPDAPKGDYTSIGQFYEAIEAGFDYVQNDIGADELFGNNQYEYQLHSIGSYWNQEGGGAPIGVTDIDTAKKAMTEIIDQGEGDGGCESDITVGADPKEPANYRNVEYSHLKKFQDVLRTIESIDADGNDLSWSEHIWPLMSNPRLSNYPETLAKLAEFFNACYCYSLKLIDANYEAPLPADFEKWLTLRVNFTKTPPGWTEETHPEDYKTYTDGVPILSRKWGLTQALLTTMTGILFPVIEILVQQKLSTGVHAGPTFEFYEFPTDEDPRSHLLNLCDALVPQYAGLAGVDSVRERIVNLPDDVK